jgi:hypothetical protein
MNTISSGEEAYLSFETLMGEHGGGPLTKDPENAANLSCGTEEETSVHVLYDCEALASLKRAYLVSFFLEPKDVTNLSKGAIWNFGK